VNWNPGASHLPEVCWKAWWQAMYSRLQIKWNITIVMWRIDSLLRGDCKQRLLLDSARNIHTHNNRRTVFCMWSVLRCYNRDVWSLVSWELSSVWESVKRRLERMKLKNLHCQKLLPGNGWWRQAGWKRLSECCGNLWILKTSSGTVTVCNSESYV
jgi:hypothetical protein